MDHARIIAEVAQRNGVLLDRDDPILTVNTMLEMHAADQRERTDELAQRDADMLAAVKQVLDRAEKQAGGQLARTAAVELPGAVDRLVLIRFQWMVALIVLCGVAVAALGFGAGWFWRATEVENVTVSGCVPSPQQSGQAFTCTFWTRPPGVH
jgi:hypothetical protein